MATTPFYAAILALLFVALSVRTLRLRHRLRIPVGDGGNQTLLRAMRVHSNFAEYVPLTLLLIFMLEAAGGPGALVHGFGVCLVVGRLVHAYGVSRTDENYRFRVFGMALTFIALVGGAVSLIGVYASAALA
ncbi:MAPEG family protein [Arhodomonas sp. AD133]|uniref:MAPEG family protein n=1 Tax=Arhodomonas sp. AD133 TaxID=3415009 RepID=UPI003EB88A55